MSRNQRLEIRVTETEKQSWARAAGGTRKVSEWLRSLANSAAHNALLDSTDLTRNAIGKTLDDVHPRPTTDEEIEALPRVPIKLLTTACPRERFHSPGTFCKACGR